MVYRQSIVECDREIERYIAQLNSVSDPSENPYPKAKRSRKRPGSNDVSFDLRSHLYRISGVDFTAVDGLEASTAFTILSEVGLDPGRFRTMKHFTSRLCLCPDNRITGGKVKSSKTRKTKNRATTAFRLAARAAGNSLGPLGTFYRRIKSRLGAPKAITATAHKLARIFYKMWKSGLGYKPEQIEYHEKMNQERTIKYLRGKAISLGFDLVSSSEEIRAVS